MKQINKPMWESEEDGRLFEDEQECALHEDRVRRDRRILAFLDSREWGRGKDTAALNVLMEFFKYEEVNGVEPNAAPPADLEKIADGETDPPAIDARNGSVVEK